MVIDRIEQAKHYYGLGSGVEQVLRFFQTYDVTRHSIEPIQLDGDWIKVLPSSYLTRHNPQALMEAHQDFCDIMFVASGEEKVFYKPLRDVQTITQAYDPKIEACLAAIDPDAAAFRFQAGQFCVFMPQDAHCAGQLWDQPVQVKKLIAKVHISRLR